MSSASDRQRRRRALRVIAASAVAAPLWPALQAPALAQQRAPTPACGADAPPTPRQTAGPFFKPRSPQRSSLLEPGMRGERLVLQGRVLDTSCQPVSGALLDVWHADENGEYDNEGYRLRGHVFADTQGRYRIETIVPGLYPGRTRHIHVNAQPPGGRVLTTQLYFPGEAANARDGLFAPELLVSTSRMGEALQATFDFILRRT
jgi:protocatechuate 3,4-dioxygenase beta subunit